MVEYSILGKQIAFSDSSLRYFDLQHKRWEIERNIKKQFDEWYTSCSNIATVLNSYDSFATNILKESVVHPLFSKLRECEIYDISQQKYENRVLTLDSCYQAFRKIESKYESILSQQEKEEYYREARKASRTRWSGGGFGLGGALKGAAQAGALNMASGLGHSVVNAVGNAGSAVAASAAKSSLYSDPSTRAVLKDGIVDSVFPSFSEHIKLINEHVPNHVKSVFNSEKASALFENAIQIPEKRKELLVQAFSFCPWSHKILKYIFVNYPEDRKAIWEASLRFYVDLSEDVEDILALLYTPTAKNSEQEAQAARVKILTIMQEFGVQDSDTLNTLEQDCLSRICQGCESADEAACNAMRTRIIEYDALDKNKTSFLEKIKMRIEEIWSAEDGIIFDNLYLQTDITSADSIAASVAYIQEKGRTSASEKYLDALNTCTEKNIYSAQVYHQGSKPKLFKGLALAFFVLAVLGFFVAGFLAALILGIVAIVFLSKASSLKSNWNKLTINNTVIHPTLTATPPQTAPSSNGESLKGKKILKTVLIAVFVVFALLIGISMLSSSEEDAAPSPPTAPSDLPQEEIENASVEDSSYWESIAIDPATIGGVYLISTGDSTENLWAAVYNVYADNSGLAFDAYEYFMDDYYYVGNNKCFHAAVDSVRGYMEYTADNNVFYNADINAYLIPETNELNYDSVLFVSAAQPSTNSTMSEEDALAIIKEHTLANGYEFTAPDTYDEFIQRYTAAEAEYENQLISQASQLQKELYNHYAGYGIYLPLDLHPADYYDHVRERLSAYDITFSSIDEQYQMFEIANNIWDSYDIEVTDYMCYHNYPFEASTSSSASNIYGVDLPTDEAGWTEWAETMMDTYGLPRGSDNPLDTLFYYLAGAYPEYNDIAEQLRSDHPEFDAFMLWVETYM